MLELVFFDVLNVFAFFICIQTVETAFFENIYEEDATYLGKAEAGQ
jgi:hypothetical protein